jgi:hypothetical protein
MTIGGRRVLRSASGMAEEGVMAPSPFIDDPRDQVARHVSAAVASPIEAVRAMHIKLAGHFADMAKANHLPFACDRASGQATSVRSSAESGS